MTALNAPWMIAYHYAKESPQDARTYYQNAIVYYQQIEKKYPKSQLALTALELHFQCLTKLGQWQQALTILQTIQKGYPTTLQSARARIASAKIIEKFKKEKEQ